MERYLNYEHYLAALDGVDLPDPKTFYEMTLAAESALFVPSENIDDNLIGLAWYLYSIAIQKNATEKYGPEKLNAALHVSAHIFDLASRDKEVPEDSLRKYIFAAQFCYILLGQDPFSIAIYKRVQQRNISLLDDLYDLPLLFGNALLALDVGWIYSASSKINSEYSSLTEQEDVGDLSNTHIGTIKAISDSARSIINYLVYGNSLHIESCKQQLDLCKRNSIGFNTTQTKWVSGVILQILENLTASCLWNIFQPTRFTSIIPAFSMINPRILTLWPPQLATLKEYDCLSGLIANTNNDRLFLSTPTSSGKTLLSQLIIALYLSESYKKVIYVAPTRALCKEVGDSLKRRMQFLKKRSKSDLPDFGNDEFDFLAHGYDIEVMTPERLQGLLRSDLDEVLQSTGMFVFDEVHNIEDASRGSTYEECISIINSQADKAPCKMVLISAVASDASRFISWIGGTFHKQNETADWRGSRRIKGTYYTQLAKEDRAKRSGTLEGWISVKLDRDSQAKKFLISKDVGLYSDSGKSTPVYQQQIPLILQLAESGPVLVVTATKRDAALMATEIAKRRVVNSSRQLANLVLIAKARLGENHKLVKVLEKGVAFHHGALPTDVRTGIEDLVRRGEIRILVSTTTVVEGVNLAVRSVLISSQGAWGANGEYNKYIEGKALLNAIGRAGRATKETEGIVILGINRKPYYRPVEADIEALSPSPDDLMVSSSLLSEDIIRLWEEFEIQENKRIAAIENANLEALFSLIWFGLSRSKGTDDEQIEEAKKLIGSTFQWNELNSQAKQSVARAITFVKSEYSNSRPEKRRFIAKGGSGISASWQLFELANEITESIPLPDKEIVTDDLLALFTNDTVIRRFFRMPNAPKSKFYSSSAGRRTEIEVDFNVLATMWIDGIELSIIAEKLFGTRVKDKTFMVDQLVDFSYRAFEIYLPSVISKCIDAMLEIYSEKEVEVKIGKDLCSYLRWGVNSRPAMDVISFGIPMRSLAAKISRQYSEEPDVVDIIGWIKGMDIEGWRKSFNCSPLEIRSLINACQEEFPAALQAFLSPGGVSYEVIPKSQRKIKRIPVEIDMLNQSDFFEIPIVLNGDVVAMVPVSIITEIEDIAGSGIPCKYYFENNGEKATINIRAET